MSTRPDPVRERREAEVDRPGPPPRKARTAWRRRRLWAPRPGPGGRRRLALVLAALGAGLVASAGAAMTLGSVPIPFGQVWGIVAGHLGLPVEPAWPQGYTTIVVQVRAPRVALGAVVGAGLSVVGMTMQALVRNPLADPYLLGISSGASLGAVAAIVAGVTLLGAVTVPAAAFVGALTALTLVYLLARSGGRMTTIRLVLAGVAVAQVLTALTSFLMLTTPHANQVRELLAWTLGGLGAAQWDELWLPAAVLVASLTVVLTRARSLNLLLAGEEAAVTMGLDVHRFRVAMFVLVSLLTGVLVAASGPIGFVGLMIPHAVRLLVGGDHRRALPMAALAGALFLVWVDVAARVLLAPQEVPVGVFTALLGGPFFLWLLRRQARHERAPGGAV